MKDAVEDMAANRGMRGWFMGSLKARKTAICTFIHHMVQVNKLAKLLKT